MASSQLQRCDPPTAGATPPPAATSTERVAAGASAAAALQRWLEWNAAYERSTAEVVKGENLEQIEQELDRLDLLRADAVRLSHEALRALSPAEV